ncbi:hypothetical protein BD847_0702 [Flavobacterium cutihirudinis]|uniref:Uncharacterized protein n=1 Tax=Flavobacterium cutihirudinis TaxID=1265740 RepID=A0A3D9G2H1_9FLAO|nr:hypothetical protein BD847_0702 [Flavobacterium cutihirudinis]
MNLRKSKATLISFYKLIFGFLYLLIDNAFTGVIFYYKTPLAVILVFI